jgi:hypothetical protein
MKEENEEVAKEEQMKKEGDRRRRDGRREQERNENDSTRLSKRKLQIPKQAVTTTVIDYFFPVDAKGSSSSSSNYWHLRHWLIRFKQVQYSDTSKYEKKRFGCWGNHLQQ